MTFNESTMSEAAQDRRNRTRHAAAYDAMRAARPLTPPPLPYDRHVVSSARWALARDIREGAYRP